MLLAGGCPGAPGCPGGGTCPGGGDSCFGGNGPSPPRLLLLLRSLRRRLSVLLIDEELLSMLPVFPGVALASGLPLLPLLAQALLILPASAAPPSYILPPT